MNIIIQPKHNNLLYQAVWKINKDKQNIKYKVNILKICIKIYHLCWILLKKIRIPIFILTVIWIWIRDVGLIRLSIYLKVLMMQLW